jgi:dynein heavy chain 2
LEIIGQSENPTVIQNHLRKLYAGIATVEFSPDQKRITAMVSAEKERVPLLHPVPVSSDVEDWLSVLTSSMVSTLQSNLLSALKEFDIAKWPSQILNLAEMIHFTADVEQAIVKGTVPALQKSLQERLRDYTAADVSSMAGGGGGTDDDDSAVLLQGKIKALVMDVIHNIDVCRQLIEAKVNTLDSWVWQKQLRFYLKNQVAVIRMVSRTREWKNRHRRGGT